MIHFLGYRSQMLCPNSYLHCSPVISCKEIDNITVYAPFVDRSIKQCMLVFSPCCPTNLEPNLKDGQ